MQNIQENNKNMVDDSESDNYKWSIGDTIGTIIILIILFLGISGVRSCANYMSSQNNKFLEELKLAPNEKIVVVSLSGGLTNNDPLKVADDTSRYYKAVSARYLSSEAAALEGKSVFYEVVMVKKEEYK